MVKQSNIIGCVAFTMGYPIIVCAQHTMGKHHSTLGCILSIMVSQLLPNMFDHSYRKTVRTPGNSVGVAISQPRVEVCSASTLGIYIY